MGRKKKITTVSKPGNNGVSSPDVGTHDSATQASNLEPTQQLTYAMVEELLAEPTSIADPKLVHPSAGPVSIRLQEVIREHHESLFTAAKSQSARLNRTGIMGVIPEIGSPVRSDSAHTVSRRLQMGGENGDANPQ